MEDRIAKANEGDVTPPFVRGQRFVVGVTGGIAAYKTCALVRQLRQAGAEVDVVMSHAATEFVTALTFQALSGRPVWVDVWEGRAADGMAHIELTRGAALMVVAPATADALARFAQGRAEDLLSTLALARACPMAVAPAMNQAMWQHPATQRNVAQLIADGVMVWGPASGAQACGETGPGRMLEPEEIFAAIEAALAPKCLSGVRVLITAGPTAEPIDPVRVLTNLSSGKMGFALAHACAQAGAEVQLIAGPVALPTPWGVRRVDVRTALEMRDAVMAHVAACDVFISVAAVADYRPAQMASQKIKKGAERLPLELVRNPDILAEVAALPNAPLCVGFAAESEDVERYARDKLVRKGLALVVANDVREALGRDDTRVLLVQAQKTTPLPPADKASTAWRIVAHLARLWQPRSQ